jgi:hypothetical protein
MSSEGGATYVSTLLYSKGGGYSNLMKRTVLGPAIAAVLIGMFWGSWVQKY